MNDGIHFTDMAQKLVAKAFTSACSLYKAGNVHKLNGRRRYFFRVIHFGEYVQPAVRHHYNAGIRLDGAERIIFRLRPGVCDRVEQRAFSDIWQSDNTKLHIVSVLPPYSQ